jgi:two-component system NtrC family sensor kinase
VSDPRLHQRLGLPLLAAGVILALVAALASLLLFEAQVEQQLRQRAEDLATSITNAADSAEHAGQLRRFVAAAGTERDIDLILVASGSPLRVVAANRNGWAGRLLTEAGIVGHADASQMVGGRTEWHLHHDLRVAELIQPLNVVSPHKDDVDLADGLIIVRLDHRFLIGRAVAGVQLGLIGLGLGLGLVCVMLWLLHARVIRPLRTVQEALSAGGRDGKSGDQLAALVQDEIGQLGLALHRALGETRLMRQALDATENAVVITDPRKAGNPMVYVNPAFSRVTGYTSAEAVGRNPRILQRGDRNQDGVIRLHDAVAAGRPCAEVLRNYRKDGTPYWNQMHIAPVRDADGVLCAWIGIAVDITEQRRRDDELQSTKAFLDAIVTHLPVAVFCKDAEDRRFRLWNEAAEQLYGLTASDVIGRRDEDLFIAAEASAFRIKDDTVLAEGRPSEVPEEPLTPPMGPTRWLHTRKVPITGPDGRSRYLLGISEDITVRRQQEQRLRAASAEAENLLSVLSSILIQVDDQDRILRFNAAAERVFALPASSVLGRSLSESGLRLDWGEIIPQLLEVQLDQRVREMHDLRCLRPDGSEVFLDLYLTTGPVVGEGRCASVLLLGHDVTRRREQEAKRAQGQKLESIGQLAAGIAHEINTPVQFIGDNLRFLADAFRDFGRYRSAAEAALADPAGDRVAEVRRISDEVDIPFLIAETPRAIIQSQEGVGRVADIVRAMKAFSHPDQGSEKQPVDLNQAVQTTLIVARSEYKYVAEVELDLEPALPPVAGHAGELNQVLLNLLVNAAQAISATESGGLGRITIRSREDRGYAELRISDSGCGIAPQHRDRIFTQFFTTKGVGRGTGQGLALCHGIISKKHGGSITFESEPGKGTTFIIRLPLAEPGRADGTKGTP